jgi:hypothetical protein
MSKRKPDHRRKPFLDPMFAEANSVLTPLSSDHPVDDEFWNDSTDAFWDDRTPAPKVYDYATQNGRDYASLGTSRGPYPSTPSSLKQSVQGTLIPNTTTYIKCAHKPHNGGIKFGNRLVYGASGNECQDYAHTVDFIVDCADNIRAHTNPLSLVLCDPSFLTKLSDHILQPAPTLKIKWPDRGVPALTFAFWPALYDSLPDAEGKNKTMVACIGGHGRTGTALACLYLAHQKGKATAKQAISFIREHHCSKAIESIDQEDYIEYVADSLSHAVTP